ncbi:hypothetical protein SAMN04515671_0094 [Nakamurella panacisegetis]|uniref:Flagellin N-terminal-like domain-containing protein n=1 Tax=Nakamurella panacisegetis TaxID=1090615 RepID=A0A1H0HJ45_9ACTN|nr:hypothetical protein [Nakamurella panacisegetis]SDO19225.1 hypothetical protein SAMN04515671_0094 [Nakamurella panacisegetis]
MPQKVAQHVQFYLSTAVLFVVDRVVAVTRRDDAEDHDRGDVPGWVMITVMTAIVVVALIAVFKPQVTAAVKNVFDSVSGSGNN